MIKRRLHIKSSIGIQFTLGVITFLSAALSENGVNVEHFLDCREDTFMVINEDNAPLAFLIISKKLGV